MTNPNRAARAVALAIATVVAPATAHAQLPQMGLNSAFPAGGRAGEAVAVQVVGTNLEGVEGLWFDHPGFRAFRLKGGAFAVAIAPDVPVGLHDVRALGPLGVSNPRAFAVGDRPEVAEVEPNDTPASATPLPLNAVANGRSQALADVDCFAFEGKAGQRVVLDVTAERLDSPMDAVLRVFGPSGGQVAESHDDRGADPVVALTLPADGRYVAKVHDVTYAGSPDHAYRLTLHDGPLIDAIVPASAPPGVASTVTLLGRNLGVGPAAGQVERKPLDVDAAGRRPARPRLRPLVGRLADGAAEVRVAGPLRPVRTRLPGRGASTPSPSNASPTTTPTTPRRSPSPATSRGLRDGRRRGHLPIQGDQGGRPGGSRRRPQRIGSQADPSFVLQLVPEKGPASDQLGAEDLADPGFGPRFPAASVDAAARWAAPEDGTYQVSINDLYQSQRGRPAARLPPEHPPGAARLPPLPRHRLGQAARRPDPAFRRQGLGHLDGRAAGWVQRHRSASRPATSRPASPATRSPSAPARSRRRWSSRPPTGRGRSPGSPAWSAEPREKATGPSPGSSVRPSRGGMTCAPVANPAGGPAPATARLARGFVLAVRDQPGFRLSAEPAAWVVGQGHQLPLSLELARGEGVVEPVTIAATDLPPTMTGVPATFAKGETAAQLPLYLPKTVPPGTYSLRPAGHGPVPLQQGPERQGAKPNVTVTAPSNPITVTSGPRRWPWSWTPRAGP